ncbi:MAG: PQQ-like beta-propeller repeat protein [Thermoguttaceae bacterium]|nr:PQQ-like beta-propeller repeat protein [Thermoguttaceae bacterium]
MPIHRLITLTTVIALLLLGLGTGLAESIWPQWRGPSRDGRITGDAWPDSLDEAHLAQLWRVELGPGYSGPIVAEERVFVTETIDRESERVTALSRTDGRTLWQAEWPGAMTVPFFARANGDWIRATPAYDGTNLYVAGMRDLLVCLDADTGQERWRVDFMAELKSALPSFGFVSSPLVHGDSVYVQAGGGFCRLDKQTGKLHWRTLEDAGGMWGSAFSSPYFATLHGVPQILVQTRQRLAGVDPDSGEVLWSTPVEAFQGMNIVTPTVYEQQLFTSSYGGGSWLFAVEHGSPEAAVDLVWRNKLQGYMSSPIIRDGHAYLHLRNQRFACLDLATGKERWITRPYGKYWSLVANDDRLLALDETGELYLIRMNPEEFELLDSRKLTDNSWAHLAVVGEEVFVRDIAGLTVYRWRRP